MELADEVMLEDRTKPTALLVGRFQPLHKGHITLIEEAIKRTGQVIIAIRTLERDEKNPYKQKDVYNMIHHALFRKYAGRYEVIIVPNITDIFYGRDVGYNIERIELEPEIESISATKIRKEMKSDMNKETLKLKYNITSWPKLSVNYIGIPKCMNTSMKATLMEASGVDVNIANPDEANAWLHQGSRADYIDKDKANLNGHKNFTIVRDPYTRLESLYSDFMIKRFDMLGVGIKLGWNDFIDYVCNTDDSEKTNVHLRSQSSFIEGIDDVFVIHLETYKKQKKFLEAVTGKTLNILHLHTDPEPNKALVWTQTLRDKVGKRYPNDLKFIHNFPT
jgi:cytidyltransferase-like protein